MGLSMDTGGGIYLSTFDGFFEQRLKEPKPGSVQRVNKMGNTINVMRFNTLTGKIAKIEYKVGEKNFGDSWEITIVDDQVYKLNLSVNSSSTFYFLNRLISTDLDLKQPVLLKVFAEIEGEKKKMVILLNQGGQWINGIFTKEKPGNLPQMEQIMFKGKLEWDSSRRDAHIRNIIEQYVVPELDATLVAAVTPAVVVNDDQLDGPHEDVEVPDWARDEPIPSPVAQGFHNAATVNTRIAQTPPQTATVSKAAPQPQTTTAATEAATVPPKAPARARGTK